MTDKTIDLNAPITQAEIQERLKNLTPEQLAQARLQQIDAAILSPRSNEAPDFASMNDQQLEEFKRRNGFYR
jgi:hypothetical protein